jgi:hypothetical protein
VPFVVQSGDSLAFNLQTNMTNSTIKVAEFGEKITDDNRNCVYFGERIYSARSLFKRYCHVMTECVVFSSIQRRFLHRFVKWKYIAYRGPDPAGVQLIVGGRWNICNWSYIHWYRLAYVGEKGGIRMKIVRNNTSTNGGGRSLMHVVQHDNDVVGYSIGSPLESSSPSGVSQQYSDFYKLSPNGITLGDSVVRPVIDAELIDYSGKRYQSTSQLYGTSGNLNNFSIGYEQNNAGALYPESVSYFISTAEDFTLFYWCGMPPVALVGDPTTTGGNPYPLPL